MDENGEILQLHASKNNARPLVLPWFYDFDFVSYKFVKAQTINSLSPCIKVFP